MFSRLRMPVKRKSSSEARNEAAASKALPVGHGTTRIAAKFPKVRLVAGELDIQRRRKGARLRKECAMSCFHQVDQAIALSAGFGIFLQSHFRSNNGLTFRKIPMKREKHPIKRPALIL